MAEWENPDVGLLYDVNRWAQRSPEWLDRLVVLFGEFGSLALALLLTGLGWWGARARRSRGDAVTGVAGVLWALLAAGLACLVNVPIRQFVARQRPAVSHDGLEVLVSDAGGYSFVSAHTTALMALGVGLFMVSRWLGLWGIGLALAQGLFRVYAGVHYPADVVGGLALGTAVALLLAPAALALLTLLTRWVAAGPVARWVHRPRGDGAAVTPDGTAAPDETVTPDETAGADPTEVASASDVAGVREAAPEGDAAPDPVDGPVAVLPRDAVEPAGDRAEGANGGPGEERWPVPRRERDAARREDVEAPVAGARAGWPAS